MRLVRKRLRKSWLMVEALEDRAVPAVTFSVVGGTLTLIGDNGPNSIQITDDGSSDPGNVGVIADGEGLILPAVNISIIHVKTKRGDDFVSYTQTNNQQGNRKITADLGDDDDVFQGVLPKDIRASKIMTMNVKGGDDDDALDVNARGFGIPNGARFNLTLSGDDDDDSLSVRYKDTLTGKMVYNGSGGDGEDAMFADLVAFDGGNDGPSTGRIVANVLGNDDDDEITLLMSLTGASTSPLDGFADGGSGHNSLIRTANVLFASFRSVTTVVR